MGDEDKRSIDTNTSHPYNIKWRLGERFKIMSDTIVLIVDDLMFLPKLENGLRHLGYQPIAATNKADLALALSKSPVLSIVDLFSQSFDWVALVQLIKEAKAGAGTGIWSSRRFSTTRKGLGCWL